MRDVEIKPEPKAKIEFRNVTYVYNEGSAFAKKALDNVSLTINEGEFIGLIGHTGSGKSTLIQHANALVKPTGGSVLVDGEDIHKDKKGLKSVRQKVGLVFQYPEHQLFEVSVFKDVAFGPGSLGLSQDDIDCRVREALTLTGVSVSDFEKSPYELSGGQKRRVAIAGVLAMRPEALILDEPTAGLDPRGRDEILETIKNMHETLGLTVVLVSHSMEDVAKLAERIVVMRHGTVAMAGAAKYVFARTAELGAMGLAAPQISVLMRALKDKGLDVPTDIFTTREATDAIFSLLAGEGGRP